MHADQNAFLVRNFTAYQGQVMLRVDVAGVGNGAEFSERGLDAAFCDAMHEAFGLEAVADEVGHGDHLEMVAGAKVDQLRYPGHAAVRIHDFADDAGGRETGEAGEVDSAFGLTGTDQYAA